MVRTEREGPVTTVILDRAAMKNAVDRATAEQLAGRAVHADEVLAIGLVNRVVPHGQALAGAQQFAEGAGRHGGAL